jgi:uncharacterized protein Yka (UPF0111/DUF47 family)
MPKKSHKALMLQIQYGMKERESSSCLMMKIMVIKMDHRNIIDRLFPLKYNFYGMLDKQAQINGLGVNALNNWLKSGAEVESEALIQYAKEADEVRMDLEKNLIEAFTTPFDREDIYSISVEMDKIIEYAKSTLLSMKTFEVKPNDIIVNMVGKLKEGADIFSESIKFLKNNPFKSGQNIGKMRDTHVVTEQLYRDGMAIVFKSDNPMNALRQREVYHHIKDASANLELTVDILHRIVVRLT